MIWWNGNEGVDINGDVSPVSPPFTVLSHRGKFNKAIEIYVFDCSQLVGCKAGHIAVDVDTLLFPPEFIVLGVEGLKVLNRMVFLNMFERLLRALQKR